MSLQNTLFEELAHIDPIEILRKIGYRRITNKTLTRLKNTLSSEYFGLDKSDYDFKYSNIEFIKALCELCAIDFNDYQEEIESQVIRINTLKHGFSPYVFVDTKFKRTSQPIFALAIMEGRRRLYLPKKYKLESLKSQTAYVKELIVEHYKNKNGVLPLWGEIESYIFNATEDSRFTFDPLGNMIESHDEDQNMAKISLGNKDIIRILKN